MPSEGRTLEFPRKDNAYENKDSIPLDEYQSQIWLERPQDEFKENSKEWFAMALVGVSVGSMAFLLEELEENLRHFSKKFLDP